MSVTEGWAEELARDGFVTHAAPLADPSITTALLADRSVFDNALAEIEAAGQTRVPYLVTDSIRHVAQDAALRAAVRTALGTDEWVMWGSNIRAATPNAAHHWHVDLESFLWPTSVTVAIGLAGCVPEGATWFVPGTHLRTSAPAGGTEPPGGPLDEQRVQVQDFRDGFFYAFNARCWHRGDPTRSAGRVILFTHFQRAAEPRIPTMLDYRVNEWSREPASYLASPQCTAVNTSVHRPPLLNRVKGWVQRAARAARPGAARSGG